MHRNFDYYLRLLLTNFIVHFLHYCIGFTEKNRDADKKETELYSTDTQAITRSGPAVNPVDYTAVRAFSRPYRKRSINAELNPVMSSHSGAHWAGVDCGRCIRAVHGATVLKRVNKWTNVSNEFVGELLSMSHQHAEKLFSERGVKVWNSLPPSIVNFSSLATFRHSLTKINFRIRNICAFSVTVYQYTGKVGKCTS